MPSYSKHNSAPFQNPKKSVIIDRNSLHIWESMGGITFKILMTGCVMETVN